MNPTSKEFKEYEKWQVQQPAHQAHGTEEDIRKNLKRVQPHNWHLEGNKLIAQTDMGELAQFIPTDYILTGQDDKGMPILEKINFDKGTTKVVS